MEKYDMILMNMNNIIFKVTDTRGFKLYQGIKSECLDYIKINSKFKEYKDIT